MVRFASIENKLNLDNNGEKFDNAERVDGLRNINHIDPLDPPRLTRRSVRVQLYF